MTLTEFLLARIAEDEAVARRRVGTGFHHFERIPHEGKAGGRIGYWLDDWQGSGFIDVTEHIARHDPARVLAECEAKRRIIELHHPKEPDGCDAWNDGRCIVCVKFHADMDCEQMAYPCPTIRALAQPYADHPDFDPEWKL